MRQDRSPAAGLPRPAVHETFGATCTTLLRPSELGERRKKVRRHFLVVAAAVMLTVGVATSFAATTKVTVLVYDDFSGGAGKWAMPYGPGESAIGDANHFLAVEGGAERIRAVPFTLGADFSVFDHLKVIETSTSTFAVPANGSLEFSVDVTASTPGTVADLTQLGVYGPSGTWSDPQNPPRTPDYSAKLLEGQQAGVVLNMIDFCTGQLFDWFLSSTKAFTLIERLPTAVTGNTANPGCPGATSVGTSEMYTQIADEVAIGPGRHTVSIRYTRSTGEAFVEYFLDGKRVTKVQKVGIPLDRQNVRYTGIYPSLGPGELLNDEISSFAIGHGLFSLLDAFPFQHPDAPELDVSIPVGTGNPADAGRARLFGQGADGTFDNFTVTTVTR
jgi:hypothetical protein